MDKEKKEENNEEELPQVNPEHISSTGNLMDSKTSHLDDVLNEKLKRAFVHSTSQLILHNIAKIACEHDPIDLAYASSKIPTKARIILYDNLPDLHAKIMFIIHTSSGTRCAIFRQLASKEIAELFKHMPADEIVFLLDDMSDRKMKKVFELMDSKKTARIKELQQHDRHSAGRLMNNEFFAFHMNTNIAEVAAHVRDNPGIDFSKHIFVLGSNQELVGYVSVRNLIINPSFLPLRKVMRPILHSVKPYSSRDEVVDLVERYEIPSLPVVDDNNRLVGVIAYEDVIEALEDIADETIASIAGTYEDISDTAHVTKRALARSPWLLLTLCMGLITATVMSELGNLSWFSVIPFFVPLITGMSGNVGIQCSTVLVRGMATGELTAGSKTNAIFKELLIGLQNGLMFSFFSGMIVFILYKFGLPHLSLDPLTLGITVSCGVFGACLTATCLGTFSPFFFAKLNIDPAVASGPIIAAFNDLASTLLFFIIARCVFMLLQWIYG